MLNKKNTEKVKNILAKRGTYYFKSGDYIMDYGDYYSLRHPNGDCITTHYKLSELLDICDDADV